MASGAEAASPPAPLLRLLRPTEGSFAPSTRPICGRVAAVNFFGPPHQGSNLKRILRAIGSRLSWPVATKSGADAFRTGSV